jgi:hypothetical protein
MSPKCHRSRVRRVHGSIKKSLQGLLRPWGVSRKRWSGRRQFIQARWESVRCAADSSTEPGFSPIMAGTGPLHGTEPVGQPMRGKTRREDPSAGRLGRRTVNRWKPCTRSARRQGTSMRSLCTVSDMTPDGETTSTETVTGIGCPIGSLRRTTPVTTRPSASGRASLQATYTWSVETISTRTEPPAVQPETSPTDNNAQRQPNTINEGVRIEDTPRGSIGSIQPQPLILSVVRAPSLLMIPDRGRRVKSYRPARTSENPPATCAPAGRRAR